MTLSEKLSKHSSKDASGCILWTGAIHHCGYGITSNRINGKNITITAHRAAYLVSYGPIPDGMCVCHKCDVKLCVNPEHLWLGSVSENNADRKLKGRNGDTSKSGFSASPPRGESNRHAKLTDAVISTLREQYSRGELNQRQAAKSLGVHWSTVQRAIKGTTWPHLTAAPQRP